MKTTLAVDLGGTKLAAALIRGNEIIEKHQVETQSSDNSDVLRGALRDLLIPLSDRADNVAVASTGIIDNGVLTALNPDNLGGLNRFPIQTVISDLTGLPTQVINDAQAAAWAEFQAYNAHYSNLAFITVSTGVGAGLVLDGKLKTGARGVAGHAGHMLADPWGSRCGCGRTGCVEVIASGTAMGRAGVPFFGVETTGRDVYTHYLAGSEDAAVIVTRSASTIAQLIADLTILLDLDAVVLGGSVGLAEGYLQLVKDALSLLPTVYQPELLPALSGADAGLIGVSLWAGTETK
ncbi:N-acetylmannosamine kinase [Enterovibrio nigricans]|uniref:N-acetylmannosamine kinase n=1 Tax=Enterovibrio nigricans DSM 22720 TaxID=1121868 RepID=A0A1T4UTG7_9GAMM|nr:N-acetylmannosamine kinase [Enterovibrio nigricans]SKA55936.1 N-acetylmannosamine kinase [Enterovibrio nigricans DSM 22720]